MKSNNVLLILIAVILALTAFWLFEKHLPIRENRFVTYIANTREQDVKLYWKDDKDQHFGSIGNLKAWMEAHNRKLLFAMNGGMYREDHTPQGLYVENGQKRTALDTSAGKGNFYVKPNGIFYITTQRLAVVCPTEDFKYDNHIAYATQSGPMLVINGKLHPAFLKNSKNLNIRNGVGILPDNRVVFVMSKREMNLYEFATYFKDLGCSNALYLDGFVSRTYAPKENWMQKDGDFGVIIGICPKTD